MFLFIIFGAIALAAALGVILSRRPAYSALFLLLNFAALAALYIMLQAQFLAAVQVIVYAGAIVVLFLFVIMLVGGGDIRDGRAVGDGVVGGREAGKRGNRVPVGQTETGKAQTKARRTGSSSLNGATTTSAVVSRPAAEPLWTRWVAIGLCVLLVAGLAFGIISGVLGPGTQGNAEAFGQGSVQAIGQALYTTYLFPFELTSVLLLVGIVGAVVLARKED
jgi:NADH-quinone oxidoreductase subunit J